MAIPPVGRSYWSYLNPLNLIYVPGKIWTAVSSILHKEDPLAGKWDKPVVVLKASDTDDEVKDAILVEKVVHKDLFELLDQSSRRYPMIKVKLKDGSELEVAKTFLSDVERSGEPDQFFIDGMEITPPPKSEEQKLALLEQLLVIAKGDRKKVSHWTELWNYRLKVNLVSDIMEEFGENYGLNPVFGRNGFGKVVLALDTIKGKISCHVEGNIDNATDEDLDTHSMKVRYTADFSYDPEDRWVETHVKFQG